MSQIQLPIDSATFRQQAAEAEATGRWPAAWLAKARKERLFHLCVPARYGGHQRPLPQFIQRIEAASYLDGSFGWTFTLGAGAGVFGAYMAPAFAEPYFAARDAFITGSGRPSGQIETQNGTYALKGHWKYATGAPHATLFTATALLPAHDAKSHFLVALLHPREVRVEPSWNSFGLKATATHNYSVDCNSIPKERTFRLHHTHRQVDAPLYRFPFNSFAVLTLASCLLGVARAFFEGANAPLVTDRWKEWQEKTAEAWTFCRREGTLPSAIQQQIETRARQNTSDILRAAQQEFFKAGMTILDEHSRRNRAFRDLHTMSQHTLLKPRNEKG